MEIITNSENKSSLQTTLVGAFAIIEQLPIEIAINIQQEVVSTLYTHNQLKRRKLALAIQPTSSDPFAPQLTQLEIARESLERNGPDLMGTYAITDTTYKSVRNEVVAATVLALSRALPDVDMKFELPQTASDIYATMTERQAIKDTLQSYMESFETTRQLPPHIRQVCQTYAQYLSIDPLLLKDLQGEHSINTTAANQALSRFFTGEGRDREMDGVEAVERIARRYLFQKFINNSNEYNFLETNSTFLRLLELSLTAEAPTDNPLYWKFHDLRNFAKYLCKIDFTTNESAESFPLSDDGSDDYVRYYSNASYIPEESKALRIIDFPVLDHIVTMIASGATTEADLIDLALPGNPYLTERRGEASLVAMRLLERVIRRVVYKDIQEVISDKRLQYLLDYPAVRPLSAFKRHINKRRQE